MVRPPQQGASEPISGPHSRVLAPQVRVGEIPWNEVVYFLPKSISLPPRQQKNTATLRKNVYISCFFSTRFNPNVLVTIALGLSAICIIAIPLSGILVILLFLAGIFGGCFGATDTFTTVQLIRMYGKQVRA